MKKGIFVVCLIAFISRGYPLNGQVRKPNFREASWGMSKEEVIKIEGEEPIDKVDDPAGLDVIGYEGKAGNLECFFIYAFAEDKLVQGKYMFKPEHSNKNLFIVDFENVKSSLTEKYGKPINDLTVWNNENSPG
jgi:hypothetical protein